MARKTIGITSGGEVGLNPTAAAAITAAALAASNAHTAAGGAHDSTAELATIMTDITAVTTAIAADKTAAVMFDIDFAVITTRTAFRAACVAADNVLASRGFKP